MVLTDREIQTAIETKQIFIDPLPQAVAYSSTSLDLGLSKYLRIWKPPTPKGVEQIVCPGAEGYKYNEFIKEFTELYEMPSDGYVLEPQSFTLGWTGESVELPSHSRL